MWTCWVRSRESLVTTRHLEARYAHVPGQGEHPRAVLLDQQWLPRLVGERRAVGLKVPLQPPEARRVHVPLVCAAPTFMLTARARAQVTLELLDGLQLSLHLIKQQQADVSQASNVFDHESPLKCVTIIGCSLCLHQYI